MSNEEATLVEAVAKAIANVLVDNSPSSWPWEKATPAGRELLIIQAQAAIKAMRAARREPINNDIQLDQVALETAAREYLRNLDIDPDFPAGLKPGAEIWWKHEARQLSVAIAAYLSALAPSQPAAVGELLTRAATAARIMMEYDAWEVPAPAPADPIDYAWTAQVISDLAAALVHRDQVKL